MNALVFLMAITAPGADPMPVIAPQPAPLTGYSTGDYGTWAQWREAHPGLLTRLRNRFRSSSTSTFSSTSMSTSPYPSTSVSTYPRSVSSYPSSVSNYPSSVSNYPTVGARTGTVNEPPLAPGPMLVAPGPLVAPGAVSMPTSSYGYRP